MTLLVAGNERVDAGKTTFSTGLIATTGAVGFKPRAGNDFWFDHDDYLDALARDTLVGKDARRLAAASPGTLDPTDINPIHRLWRPAPGTGTGMLRQEGREFVLDRAGEQYVINGAVEVPDSAREHLPVSEGRVVDTIEEFNRVMQRQHLSVLDEMSRTIQTTDRAVVESYGDVARPVRGIEPDAVAVVEPARAQVFDGSRFRNACEVATGTEASFEGRLEKRVPSVLELVDPEATVELPPLSDEARSDPDAVATAYAPAYEAVLDVAGWS